jgi:NADPH-dependent curcumin reductase CurA
MPTPENFTLATVEVPAPGEGQVLVRNLYMSVDPYMRGRMNDVKSYVPPFQVGQVLDGGAIGEVVVSRAKGFAPGDVVLHGQGWREQLVASPRELTKLDRGVQPLSSYLGVLGMPGFTAWLGLDLVDVKKGDRVFISGAAGAVGSIAGQLAKLRGCRVVGSAGSKEKVALLTGELGFDAAFDYKDGDLPKQLEKAAPEGIDVYFDNVGGEHLEAALGAMRNHGRIIACGAISRYNDAKPGPGPRNMVFFISKRLTMKGFIVTDSLERMPSFLKEVGGYLAQGKLRSKETVVAGLERAPEAFIDLLRGGNTGKMVVKLTAP